MCRSLASSKMEYLINMNDDLTSKVHIGQEEGIQETRFKLTVTKPSHRS